MQLHALPPILLVMLLSACQQPPRSGLDFKDRTPERLSEWHVFQRSGDVLTLDQGVMPYDLNTPLFSDYAHKFRSVYVPDGTAIRYGEDELEFPVGTVISKTFYYPVSDEAAVDGTIAVRKVLEASQGASLDLRHVRLLETRLLVHTASGWVGLPYVWNVEQTEAILELAGESFSLAMISEGDREAFTYMVPDANQCANCHAVEHREQILKPIGVKTRHLNKQYKYADTTQNQLARWKQAGLLTGLNDPTKAPRLARWDEIGNLDARARAYLDVNCGHCHSAQAAANTSGLLLDAEQSDPTKLGVCKIPVAAGRGSGTASFDIVPGSPEESILLHRMKSTEPDVAMPELGRSLVHREGVALIAAWIASLPGNCEAH